mmetsp:Transcript_5693/g.12626  ORF Transcript_5693/g.12626 Transcript_5693/m.12626 type:complete len:84 (-) Transcript_5693:1234-1485(-)
MRNHEFFFLKGRQLKQPPPLISLEFASVVGAWVPFLISRMPARTASENQSVSSKAQHVVSLKNRKDLKMLSPGKCKKVLKRAA